MKVFATRLLAAALCSAAVFTAAALAQTPAAQPTPQPVPQPAPRPSAPVPAPQPPSVEGTAWVLMDYATGQVLMGHNPDGRVEPASITKVMTSYVVSAEVAAGKVGVDDQVRISENAWRVGGGGTDGSTSFLPVNSEVRLQDLLYGMIIQSGNDASIALAEHVAGSEEAFADLMNNYAQKLGLTGTHFTNATGLPDPELYTTAHDIALLSRALIRDFPEDYEVYAKKELTLNGITQHNRNSLLWRDATVDGIKTGHTAAAGYCLAASAEREGMRLISVVMGSSGEKKRADDSQAILNYGFRFFESHQLYAAGEKLAEPRLWKSELSSLPLGLSEPLQLTVARGKYDQIKAVIDIPKPLIGPFEQGQQVGTLRLSLDDQPLVERPLVALQAAPEAGFLGRTWDGVMMWWESE
ncbi:D-alanyl-D-alanine carboxypeptidase family protein [Aquimonas sp.]|jgi:D-alanyl-D-alanine carboxypeptidase (penicillin-binding protein 5/6)|uniref:D-alanyl-D-alanine carboxypeptidase family protein n=1 Tax=Aquimonas sp. TaxID=1872588 RepID=UPI0037BF13FC